jgi:hypothetical protein
VANSEQVELSGVEEASAIEMETANKKGGSNSPVRGIKVIKDERSKRTKKADEKLAEKKMSLRKSATGDQSNLAEKKAAAGGLEKKASLKISATGDQSYQRGKNGAGVKNAAKGVGTTRVAKDMSDEVGSMGAKTGNEGASSKSTATKRREVGTAVNASKQSNRKVTI